MGVGEDEQDFPAPILREGEFSSVQLRQAEIGSGRSFGQAIPIETALRERAAAVAGSVVLLLLGIRHLFAAVVTSEDVINQKPAPDIFLEAARRIGVTPQLCRAYEDTDLGLEAIRAANMEGIDVRTLLAEE